MPLCELYRSNCTEYRGDVSSEHQTTNSTVLILGREICSFTNWIGQELDQMCGLYLLRNRNSFYCVHIKVLYVNKL